MIGTTLHEYDSALCGYLRANLRHHRHDPHFLRALKQELPESLRTYVLGDEDEGPAPHERALLGFDDLYDLEHFATNGPPSSMTWFSDTELHKRSAYPIPEIRAHLTAQSAEEWAVASSGFARALEVEDLPLAEGIARVAEWILDARRLLRAMGALHHLPHPEGTFPTPSCPEPPPTPSLPETPSTHQGLRDGALVAAIAETQVLQREVRDLLVSQRVVKDYYSTEEAAQVLGKAEFTVREWCRLGRIRAAKKGSGRGKHQSWVIGHDELLRYQREGLRPSSKH